MNAMKFILQAQNYKHDWWRFLLVIGSSYVMSFIIAAIVYTLVLLLFGISGNIVFFEEIINTPAVCPFPFIEAIISFSWHCFFLIGFIIFFKLLHKGKWNCLVNSFSKFRWNRLLCAISLELLLSLLLLNNQLEQADAKFVFNVAEFLPYLLVLIVMLPIQVYTEEIFSRSYLGQMVGLVAKYPIIPIVITSIVFTLFHYGDLQYADSYVTLFSAIGILGIMYGFIMVLDDGIEICLGLHLANNLFAFVVFKESGLSGLFERQIYYKFGWIEVLFQLIYAIIILLVFTKLYHWDWRRLFQKIERPAVIDNGTMNCY